MVMNYQVNVANPLGGLGSAIGGYIEREGAQNTLNQAAEIIKTGDTDAIADFMLKNPQAASAIMGAQNFRNQATKQNAVQSAVDVLTGRMSPQEAIDNRVNFIRSQGGDPTDTEGLRAVAGNPEAAQRAAWGTLAVHAPEVYKNLREALVPDTPGALQVQSSEILPDGSTVQVFKDGSTRVTGPQGKVLTGSEREQAVETAQEFGIDVQSRRAAGRTGATETEKRAGALIARGITAAESTATIRRAITLLDKVQTGGPEAISLAVKQRLGIEGADEGELSNSLGKAVLSQLRETFGAAFTQEEGKRLERIEASFSKSPETNKRLLQQALRISENTARRARSAAIARGSEAEAADIDDLLQFTLDIDEGGQPLPTGVSEEDIQFTMEKHGLSREEVLQRINP